MNNLKKSRDRLYKGLSHEQYTISQLNAKGYEAHKPHIDQGFDVEATKLYDEKSGNVYKFQIKSRYIKKEYIIEKTYEARMRKTLFLHFQIKKSDFDVLLEQEYSYLVCYIAEAPDDIDEYRWGEFWLSSNQLHYLKEQGYLSCSPFNDTVSLYTFIIVQADLRPKIDSCFENIDKLLTTYKQDEIQELNNHIQKLKNLISRTKLLNINSNRNVYITPEWKNEHGKQCLSRRQHDFLNFDMEPVSENPFVK